MYAPIARISQAMARHGIDVSLQTRRIDDAKAEQIARIGSAAPVIHIK